MHANLPRDVARCRDADNIFKVCAANVDLGCYNVTNTPPCTYRLFVLDGFSIQLPVVSEGRDSLAHITISSLFARDV